MCGIAGFVTLKPVEGGGSILQRMTDIIRHRGPNDSGHYSDANRAFLGHRRLSIIDLSGGHQPMSNEDGTDWIVYNGEVFNHASLRPALEQAGHTYSSHCDTETILHAYEEHGERCVELFRGMFAFAIWDSRRQTLFCARDRLGIKPLYYYWDGTLFAFASEIKALLEHPGITARLDPAQLPEYLAFGYTSGEQTMFAGISKLMPGHTLTLDMRGERPALQTRSYWDIPALERGGQKRSDREWIEETRQRLEESVRTRLMSDVPLGMFLSGGVDSAAIASLMRRLTTGPVKTFAVGYQEREYSELSYAAEAARLIGTEHHEVTLSRDEFFQELPRLVWHEDEPISWPSSVSLYFVSRLASEHVKVVLTGEGSDELFAGYHRYAWNVSNQAWADGYGRAVPSLLRNKIRGMIETSSLLSGTLRRKLGHSVLGRKLDTESLFLDNFYGAFSRPEIDALLRDKTGSPYAHYFEYWNRRGEGSLLQRMLYADQKTYLVELLMKQDQMSMACSIESRVPFLDHPFVEFAARMPDEMKLHGKTGKYVLKEAVSDLIPPEILHRKKMGFPTPLRTWLQDPNSSPLIKSLFDPDGFLASTLDLDQVRVLLDRHSKGTVDATDRIWRLLNLQIWGDLYLSGRKDRWLRDGSALLLPA